MIVWYSSSERKHVYEVFGTFVFFIFEKKKKKKQDRNWRKQDKVNQKKVNCEKKFVVRCFAYFALASLIALFPHKGAWYWKGSSCNAGTLCLNSGQLCHGRQFRAWLWTARFWDQKVSYCYTNVCVCFFLFFFFIFGSFLISWANWVLLNLRFVLDDFKGERLPHAQRKRWDVKNMFLDLISTNLYFSSGFGWIGLV